MARGITARQRREITSDPSLGNSLLGCKPLPQGMMNGGWHSPKSQKVQIQVLLTLWIWASSFSCWDPSHLTVIRDKAPWESWEELMWSCTGRHALGLSRGLCQMLAVTLFFRSLASHLFLILTRSWSLILEQFPKPRRDKNLILFYVWLQSVFLINMLPVSLAVRKQEKCKVWGEWQRPHYARTSVGTERAHSSWINPVFFLVKWFTCWGILVWNVQTLVCLSWASKWVGDFYFCFPISLLFPWKCNGSVFQPDGGFLTSCKYPGEEALSHQRNIGHFKCYPYSLNFLVFFQSSKLNYKQTKFCSKLYTMKSELFRNQALDVWISMCLSIKFFFNYFEREFLLEYIT